MTLNDSHVKCKYCGCEHPIGIIKCYKCGEFVDEKYKWKGVRVTPSWFQKVFCTHCHHEGSPKTITTGSIIIEAILWLFVLPGMLYSANRHNKRYCVCKKCGSDQINLL